MPKKRINQRVLLVTGIAVLAVAVMLTAGLHAKYVREVTLNGAVEFSSELAEAVTLNESKATLTDSGRYTLDETQKVLANSYQVMPGVDIPKDPTITVTGKTGVPSYLYVKIDETDVPESVSYSLCSHWTAVEDFPNVYVYTGTDYSSPIPILEDNKLTVLERYDGEAFGLDFTAYLYQKRSNDTPKDAYDRNN